MKAVMYHYVRRRRKQLPFSVFLDIDDFCRQLDFIESTDRFISREELFDIIDGAPVPDNGTILTFDDGLRDHYDHVFPELKRRGLWGCFYVCTGPYESGQLLDVHRVHYLLGRYGGAAILSDLEDRISPDMVSYDHVEEFTSQTYHYHTNGDKAAQVKRLFNYFLSEDWRTRLLDDLMGKSVIETDLARGYYCSLSDLRTMQDGGMVIGSHSVSHPAMSKIPESAQAEEIGRSFDFLEDATGGLVVRTFAYPYGHDHTFTKETERFLEEGGCRFAFGVEPVVIRRNDIENRPQALGRYDCNLLPYGQPSPSTRPDDALLIGNQ